MTLKKFLTNDCKITNDKELNRIYYTKFKDEQIGNTEKAKIGILESRCIYCNMWMDIEVKFFKKDDILNVCSCSHENWGYNPNDLKILHINGFIKD
jgi:hypothetical protein